MNITVSLILSISIGVICSYIHKNKLYSTVSGFLWGFFFSIIGLLVVLFERNKEDQIAADKGRLSMTQWLLIFF